MATNDSMSDRFKDYESAAEQILPRRLPVLIRLDGNSFSNFTKVNDFQKPFDSRFERAMEAAATAVLEYCAGAQLAYVQSDEITILLRNDQTHQTDPFLGNRTQKIASLLAATASVAFNDSLREWGMSTRAVFDARVFVVPPADVNNAFLWRQRDAFRNCIQGFAYHRLRDATGRKTAIRMLHGKSLTQQQEIIRQELEVEPSELPTEWLRGRTILRETFELPLKEVMPAEVYEKMLQAGKVDPDGLATRSRWTVDREIPEFSQNTDYIERFLAPIKRG